MGKPMVGLARFLLLYVLLLAVPGLTSAQETLTAPFVNGPNGATTLLSYFGSLTIKVSGVGQAAATAFSDAFYVFTNNSGNPIPPEHHFDFGLCINNQTVDNYLATTPPYRSDHTYQFTISIGSSPQHLTFGVCDGFTSDNSGSYTITVKGQATQPVILEVTKESASNKAAPGGQVLYTVVIENNSDADATNVTLEDKLPVKLWPLIERIMPTQGSCQQPPPFETPINVHCDLGEIAAGESARITYAVGVIVTAKPGKISNLVTVKSDQSTSTTAKAEVDIVKPGEISDKEINDVLEQVRKCGVLFTDIPFIDNVNTIIDELNGQTITPLEAGSNLVQNTMELIGRLIENQELQLLSDLFNVQACIKYGRLLFSL